MSNSYCFKVWGTSEGDSIILDENNEPSESWQISEQTTVSVNNSQTIGSDDRSGLLRGLSSLRQLKDSSGIDLSSNRGNVSRASRSTIDFTSNNYEDYKMRRKAEVLKYKNNNTNNLTKKQKTALIARGLLPNNSATFIDDITCTNIALVPSSNSNVPHGSLLFFDKSVPFYNRL